MLPFGLFVTVWGLLLAWIGHEKGDTALLAPGLVVAASGVWIAGLHRLVRNRATGLAVMGGLFVGWGVVGGTAAVLHRFWIGAFMCSALLVTGLLLLGMLPLPTWAQRPLAVVRKIGFGLVFMGVGLVITAVGLAGGASEGVPPFVPVVAGLVFFLGGFWRSSTRAGAKTRFCRARSPRSSRPGSPRLRSCSRQACCSRPPSSCSSGLRSSVSRSRNAPGAIPSEDGATGASGAWGAASPSWSGS